MDRHIALDYFASELDALRSASLFKEEHVIKGPQDAKVEVKGTRHHLINLCANNYLGLSNEPHIVAAAEAALSEFGYGMSSVRFICGTQNVHKMLENRLSHFLGTEDTILYSSCFDANTGLFETLLDERDAVISDELNHASIIDGVRLCRARRFRYKNNNMSSLREQLVSATDARFKLIVTDGVFSMDGLIADLPGVCNLAEEFGALTVVDDSHAVGFFGARGSGTPEHFGVADRIDLVTGTLGKALGGASGGYTSGRKELIGWLRQRSRPYLFSNALPPVIAAASIAVLDRIEGDASYRNRLWANTRHFRTKMAEAGFNLAGAGTPIVPLMLGDAAVSAKFAELLLRRGVFVVSFSYPVVPRGKARLRTQLSAAHDLEILNAAIDQFVAVGRELRVIR